MGVAEAGAERGHAGARQAQAGQILVLFHERVLGQGVFYI